MARSKADSALDAQEARDHKAAIAEATAGLPPKIIKVSEELSCELNEVEWQNKARELAEAHKDVTRQEERKKTVSAGLSNDVKIAKAKESKLADIVSSREEQREVTVEVKYDYDLGRVIKTRTDNNQVISDREMTDNERQAELELTDADDLIPSRHEDPAAGTAGSPFDADKEDSAEDAAADGDGEEAADDTDATDTEDSDDEEIDEDDLMDDDDTIKSIPNLDSMSDADLETAAEELSVDLAGCVLEGDEEATRENIKTAIREEISRRADVEEEGQE